MINRIVDLTNKQIDQFVQELYDCFDTGYDFEEFVKIYLEKLGFDEVVVTQKSRDGGVDLTVVKLGIGGISTDKGQIDYEPDKVKYCVQAKRYKPKGSTKVTIDDIDRLRGSARFKSGQKGIYITTGKFTKDAIISANQKPEQAIILIDGEALIKSMLDINLGFVFIPKFEKELINKIMKKEKEQTPIDEHEQKDEDFLSIDKIVTYNDIRARIIGVPQEIVKQLDENLDKIKIKMGDLAVKEYKYNKERKCIYGVTNFFKKYGFIDEAGIYHQNKVKWTKNGEIFTITIDQE